jgi:hypothetical protein
MTRPYSSGADPQSRRVYNNTLFVGVDALTALKPVRFLHSRPRLRLRRPTSYRVARSAIGDALPPRTAALGRRTVVDVADQSNRGAYVLSFAIASSEGTQQLGVRCEVPLLGPVENGPSHGRTRLRATLLPLLHAPSFLEVFVPS